MFILIGKNKVLKIFCTFLQWKSLVKFDKAIYLEYNMCVILYFMFIKMVKNIEIKGKASSFREELDKLKTEVTKEREQGVERLTKAWWKFNWPSGPETWYDLPMKRVVKNMADLWYTEKKWYKFDVRSDGVKVLGKYVMVAANIDKRPKGTLVKTSLGMWIVCDKCDRAHQRGNERLIDIAVDWKNHNKE